MTTTIAFLGCGHMGSILARAAAKALPAQNIRLTDYSSQKAAALAAELGARHAASNLQAIADSRFIVLAMKPQQIPAVLTELAPAIQKALAQGEAKVLVSIAAGVTLQTLQTLSQCDAAQLPVVRLMPNTPCSIGHGQILAAIHDEAAQAPLAEISQCLQAVGSISSIDEAHMNAATIVSASAPAFGYLFIEALADGGVRAGLSRQDATQFAARAIKGAAEMILQSGQSPGTLKDAVCSPAGTTIAGIAALEQYGLRHATIEAVAQAVARAEALSRPPASEK